ncbi:MAG: DUF3394 domain-containing protein, partial [Burkholderiaceae bacterium]
NYILMATLMAPVVVELGAQSGMVIPLIAVHMFVFYYGIMADITPPVGLATFAAAAISGESPLATGVQGTTYATRTAVLPFMFIFNPMLLLIDVSGWLELLLVVFGATVASLTFAAATMFWFRSKCSLIEVLLLLLVSFALFRPDWFMNHIAPKYESRSASQIYQIAAELPQNGRFVAVLSGMNLEGDDLSKTVAVGLKQLPEDSEATGDDAGRQRLSAAGLTVVSMGDMTQIASVRFGSTARRAGWEQGWEVRELLVSNPNRPSEFWVYLPALVILGFIWALQGRRLRRDGAGATPAVA